MVVRRFRMWSTALACAGLLVTGPCSMTEGTGLLETIIRTIAGDNVIFASPLPVFLLPPL